MRHLILLVTLVALMTLAEPAKAYHTAANEYAERANFRFWLVRYDHVPLVVAKLSYRSRHSSPNYFYCDDCRHGHRRHVHYADSYHYEGKYDWREDHDDHSDSDSDSDDY